MRTTLLAAVPAIVFTCAAWAGVSTATVAPAAAKDTARPTAVDCCAHGEDCCSPPQVCCAGVTKK